MPTTVDWIQTVFNTLYLLIVWGLALDMAIRYRRRAVPRPRTARWILISILTLAFGDSFHLLPRIYRVLIGPDAAPAWVMDGIALGLFLSSVTLSFVYFFWQIYAARKFDLAWGAGMWFLTAVFILRLILLLFPQNQWGGEPNAWKFYRNIPFTIQGMGVVWLFLRHAGEQPPRTARALRTAGYAIIASFAFYIGTLVGTLWHPAFGSLMLPKIVAYVVAVVQLYRVEFRLPA